MIVIYFLNETALCTQRCTVCLQQLEFVMLVQLLFGARIWDLQLIAASCGLRCSVIVDFARAPGERRPGGFRGRGGYGGYGGGGYGGRYRGGGGGGGGYDRYDTVNIVCGCHLVWWWYLLRWCLIRLDRPGFDSQLYWGIRWQCQERYLDVTVLLLHPARAGWSPRIVT